MQRFYSGISLGSGVTETLQNSYLTVKISVTNLGALKKGPSPLCKTDVLA